MTFKLRYFVIFLVLFITEGIIATYVKQSFIRYVFGDFLVVIMLYCFIRSFIKASPLSIALIVLIISFLVEFGQLINIVQILQLPKNTITNLVLGTTFSISDLVAYTLGVCTVFLIDNYPKTQSQS